VTLRLPSSFLEIALLNLKVDGVFHAQVVFGLSVGGRGTPMPNCGSWLRAMLAKAMYSACDDASQTGTSLCIPNSQWKMHLRMLQ